MRLFIRLLSYVRPHWRRLTAALVCMVVFALLSGVSLGMMLPFLNVLFERDALVYEGEAPAGAAVTQADGDGDASLIESDGSGAAPLSDAGGDALAGLVEPGGAVGDLKAAVKERALKAFTSGTPEGALGRICLALLAVFLVKNLFGYLQTFLMITVEQRVIRDLRDSLFDHLNRLSLSFFHGRRTGQLISRVTNDVMLVKGALAATFANLFRESLLAIIYLGVAVWISWRLALLTFIVLPPILYLIYRIGLRLRKRSVRIQERMADITSTLQESISGIRVVKAFGMEDYERERFFKHTMDYLRTYVRKESLGALASPLTEFLGVVGVVVVLWYGGRQVLLGGAMSPDWFILFLAATLSTMQPLRNVSKANNQLQTGLAAAGRVFSILDTIPSIASKPGAEPARGFSDAIRYEGVHFSYLEGEPVLKGVDLSIQAGEVVAVVGPSGAGKSTLLDLLPRFYDPTAGRITVDGRDLRDVELVSLRNLMGIVTQETILFNDTVRNNIAYGLSGASDEAVESAARTANAHGFISDMPEGYDTAIGERGVRISGGERQRIAIARAILKNPPILIFDEATSSLDTESERLVQEAIERLFVGRTVLLIAHRLSTVRNADRILVMENGRVVESGAHDALMKTGGVYRRLYDMQFRNGSSQDDPDGRSDD